MMEPLVVKGFDLHCHIDLFPDPAALIASCDEDQIVALAVTTTPLAWAQNKHWTAGSRYVHAAVGLHPELVRERHAELPLLEEAMEEARFIGEVGLDGSPQHRKSWGIQKEVFARILSGAQRLGGRVASIHSRRAAADVLRCIEEHTTVDRLLPILHWFSDSASLARRAVRLGCYFSINQRMLTGAAGMELIRNLPSDRLLTETDAPFTTVNGRTIEPRDVPAAVARLAIGRGTSVAEMRETLTTNARNVFAFAGIDAAFEFDPS